MDARAHSSTVGLTRRAAVGSLIARGAGFALFVPSGLDEQVRRARRQGRLILDYWEKWTSVEGEAMRAVVDRFNQSQPRIYVRYLVTATIHQKALVAIAGGDAPDIIGMYSENVATYAEANAVLALDELALAAGLSLDLYARGMRQVMQHRGRWWGVVNTGGTLAMYYNRRLFAQAGLDPDKPPATIAEWGEANRRLARREGNRLIGVGHLPIEPGWWPWMWGYYFGGAAWDPQSNRCTFGAEPNQRAYEWVQRTARDLGYAEVERFRAGLGPYGTDTQGFLTGKVAMVVQGPWMANQLTTFAPDLDYGVAPVPVAESMLDPGAPVALVDTDVLMIPRNARHPEASMEFIAFTQRQDVVEQLARVHCKGSPLATVSEEFLRTHKNRGVELHTRLADSPRAFTAPATPAWAEMKDVFSSTFLSIWKGEAAPRDRLIEAQGRCNDAIDRHREQLRRRGESA